MNRGERTKRAGEQPIEKPNIPLPLAFSPSRQTGFTTRRKNDRDSAKRERAYFFRKGSNGSSPVYDFVITTEGPENETRSDN